MCGPPRKDKNAPDQSGQGLKDDTKPKEMKSGSNDIQDTVKASGLTLALISALTTRYSSTWMVYKPGVNQTADLGDLYQLKIGQFLRETHCRDCQVDFAL